MGDGHFLGPGMNGSRRVGRPAKRAEGGVVTLTVRLPAVTKNWLVDQASALDLSLSEFIVSLVGRNAR